MAHMVARSEPEDTGDAEEERLSKSARKREAASLQELGVQLSALPEQEMEALDLPEKLFVALRDLRRLPSHGAQVRQRQYIGKLMRQIDPEPVLAKLAERKQRHDSEIRHFQRIERWRDRLLSEPETALPLLLRGISAGGSCGARPHPGKSGAGAAGTTASGRGPGAFCVSSAVARIGFARL